MKRRHVREHIHNYFEFRNDYNQRQVYVVFGAAAFAVTYSLLAPTLLAAMGLVDIESGKKEFLPALFMMLPVLLISIFMCFSPTAKKERFRKIRSTATDILTWVSMLAGYSLAYHANYFSCRVDGYENLMVFLIISVVFAAVLYVPVGIFSIFYILASCALVAQTYILTEGDWPLVNIYNLIFFFLVVLITVWVRYLLGYQNFRQKEEIRRMKESSEQFMSQITHEMRTPLNAVLGKNELILRETKEAETKKLSLQVASSGKILLSLINDVLDLSKIQSGRMNIVPATYNCMYIQKEVEDTMRSEAEGHGLRFIVDSDPETPYLLFGDEIRIRQVLFNLMSNAIKYTREGSVTLRQRCRILDEKNCELTFAVVDTGIGIRPEDMNRLAEAYVRLDEKVNRRTQGTGLGLSITSSLLKLMDSQLVVESEYGRGSTFSFTIVQGIEDSTPVREMIPKLASEPSTAETDLSGLKILIVDDNRVNYTVVKGLMKVHKVLPEYAESGSRCLELLKDHHYDLIFLDHVMPEMDGVETLEKIRSLYPAVILKTPIYALTASDASDADARYRSLGFTGYLAKPVNPRKLELVLKECGK